VEINRQSLVSLSRLANKPQSYQDLHIQTLVSGPLLLIPWRMKIAHSSINTSFTAGGTSYPVIAEAALITAATTMVILLLL